MKWRFLAYGSGTGPQAIALSPALRLPIRLSWYPRARRLLIGLIASLIVATGLFMALTIWTNGDFRGTLWLPGQLIREGLSPYPGEHASLMGAPSVYPPPLILAAGVPLSTLSFPLASAAWDVLLVACAGGALLLMGVRDWRCYVVALLGVPFAGAILYGNPTPIVVLLVAVAYHWRRSMVVSALALAAALTVKPFVLPMLLWRRTKGAILTASAAAAFLLVGWSAIGFAGLRDYQRLLDRLTAAQGSHGASLYAIASHVGASERLATIIAASAAAVVLLVGRMHFNAAVLASLLFAPITWSAYFALLYLVIATQSPRFSARWLVGFFYIPLIFSPGSVRPLWALLIAVGTAVYICCTKPSQPILAETALSPAPAGSRVSF